MNSLYLHVRCCLLLHQVPGTNLSDALKIKLNRRSKPLNEGVIIEPPLLRMNSQTESHPPVSGWLQQRCDDGQTGLWSLTWSGLVVQLQWPRC